MDFNLTGEQQMLRDSAERYVRESYTFEYRAANRDTPAGCSEELWRAFAELGWLGVAVPEEMGGLGFSAMESAILMEELGRGLVLEPYLGNAVLCAEILRHSAAGSELLPMLVEGRLRLALAHAEPQSRYGFADDPRTSATRDGDGYRLDGGKLLVLDGPSAHRLLVTAVCPGNAERGLFLVPADCPGVTVTSAYPLIDDTRACDIEFSGVRVPESALILSGNELDLALGRAFDATVLAQCAGAIGAMEKVIAIAGEYVKTRVQFGQPIGKFQAIQHYLADMFVEVQESRSAHYRAMAHMEAAAELRAKAVSTAKVTIARAGKVVGGLGIQLHGGYGMTEEYQAGHYFRYLTAFEKKFGDLDFHLKRMSAG